MKLGIPRALLYYDHAPLWSTLLEGLGFELVISPPTNKAILDLGVNRAPDEACLPVKICYGHLAALEEKVDALFLPRMVSERPKTFFCPAWACRIWSGRSWPQNSSRPLWICAAERGS